MVEFLVKWKDKDSSYNTWVPRDDLEYGALALARQFEEEMQKKQVSVISSLAKWHSWRSNKSGNQGPFTIGHGDTRMAQTTNQHPSSVWMLSGYTKKLMIVKLIVKLHLA